VLHTRNRDMKQTFRALIARKRFARDLRWLAEERTLGGENLQWVWPDSAELLWMRQIVLIIILNIDTFTAGLKLGPMKDSGSVDAVENRLCNCLSKTGLRPTPQRQRVYTALLETPAHPTAEEVFMRVKQEMPDISLATVYNCLDTFVQCGLVRQVVHERGATRYCANTEEHHHFYCDECHGTYDIPAAPSISRFAFQVPAGFVVRRFEIVFQGLCPKCLAKRSESAEYP